VATDLSPGAGLAVARAAHIAREHDAHLTALHVLPAGLSTELVDCARAELESHLARCLNSTPADVVIREGVVADQIAKEAAARSADLVVVGTHGMHWLADSSVGSTADNVVRISPAALLLVRNPTKAAYRAVVLALDDSPAATDAARFASALTPSAEHTLIHICVVVGENLMRMHGVDELEIDALRKTCTESSREYLNRLAASLTPTPARIVVETGHPPTELIEYCRSQSSDLAVVGTGARTSLSYILLGSVAQHMMRQSPSDVLVAPAVKD